VINENFLKLLSRHVNVRIIPLAKADDLITELKNIEKYKFDYLYIDSFSFLLKSFLLREKFGITVPFICTIHTIAPWSFNYIYAIPLIRKYDIVFAPSMYARQSILRISDKLNVHVVPYMLDVNHIENIAADVRKKRCDKYKIISFLGRIVEGKGIGSLISCMPDVVKKVKNARLHIIGPLSSVGTTDLPKSTYVKYLERKINRLNLKDKIRFLGVRLGDNKYRALASTDLFVNPTVAKEETFSIANIEALSCSLPVIATDWAANNEIIKHGRNGYITGVKSNRKEAKEIDIEKASFVITKVLNDDKLRVGLRKNAIKSVQTYDYKRIMPVFIKLLKKRKIKEELPRWNSIKNKMPLDFKDIFTKDAFFFINFGSEFRASTYNSLFQKMFEKLSSGRSSKNISGDGSKKKRPPTPFVDSIRREFISYLTLK